MAILVDDEMSILGEINFIVLFHKKIFTTRTIAEFCSKYFPNFTGFFLIFYLANFYNFIKNISGLHKL